MKKERRPRVCLLDEVINVRVTAAEKAWIREKSWYSYRSDGEFVREIMSVYRAQNNQEISIDKLRQQGID